MVRIFLALAFFSFSLLVANVITGFVVGDLNSVTKEFLVQKVEIDLLQKSSATEAKTKLEALRPAFTKVSKEFNDIRARQNVHFLLGVLAALVAVLINSISVTYFIGTSRWCQEVSDTYHLKDDLVARSRQLKRRTFPWSLASICLILAIAMLGAASDPGANQATSASWVQWHRMLAILTTGFVGWSYLMQVGAVGANFEIIDEILTRVNQVREEKGLEPNPEA